MQYDHAVKVDDGVEPMRHGDDGAGAKLSADEGLDELVGMDVDARIGIRG